MYVQTTGGSETLGYFRLIKYGLLIGFIAVAYHNINQEILVKILVIFVFVNLSAFLLQYILYFLTGIGISFVLPFLPLVNAGLSTEGIETLLSHDFRPGGLFLEPAHFSYYMFFAGLFLNSSTCSKKRFIVPLICAALFSTYSSFGFLAGLYLILMLVKNSRVQLKIVVSLLALAIIPFAIGLIVQIPQLARLIEPDSVAVFGRLYGGDHLIEQLNDHQRLIGLGFGNFYFDGFVNGIAFLRLSFGNVGIGMILALIIFYVIRNYNHTLILYVLTLIVISVFTPVLFSVFLLMALLPFLTINKTGCDRPFVSGRRL
jgi:hypothetical protein